jgi:hypothetical protein
MQPTSPIQCGKTDTFFLTVLTSIPRLKGVVIEFTNLIVKQTFGGKVTKLKPPKRGFFMSATRQIIHFCWGLRGIKYRHSAEIFAAFPKGRFTAPSSQKTANVKYTFEVKP